MKTADRPSPYHLESCFDRTAMMTPHGRRKAHLFAALVPADCSSILDAGGGTGWSTIGMRAGRRVVTLDSSAESLAHAIGETVQASVDDLPFADRAFDMVLSSQVLEHLPDDVLQKAAAEMMRVAKDYLLVSAPYREALETRFVRCGACGWAFHPDYHCRAFAERDLAALFPGWAMAEWHVFGPLKWGVGVDPLHPARPRRPGPDLPFASESTVCPRCGRQGGSCNPNAGEAPVGLGRRLTASLMRRLARVFPRLEAPAYPTFLPQNVAPYWIAGLFIREDAAPLDGDVSAYSDVLPS